MNKNQQELNKDIKKEQVGQGGQQNKSTNI